jgi:hypothetical protein
MLAEAHKPDLEVKAFELDYSWPLHSALTNVLQGPIQSKNFFGEWGAYFATSVADFAGSLSLCAFDPRVPLAALAHPGLNSVAGYAGSLNCRAVLEHTRS